MSTSKKPKTEPYKKKEREKNVELLSRLSTVAKQVRDSHMELYESRDNIEGFSVTFMNGRMFVSYSSFFKNDKYRDGSVARELENVFATIVKEMKEKYSELYSDALSLVQEGDIVANITAISLRNVRITAKAKYRYLRESEIL